MVMQLPETFMRMVMKTVRNVQAGTQLHIRTNSEKRSRYGHGTFTFTFTFTLQERINNCKFIHDASKIIL